MTINRKQTHFSGSYITIWIFFFFLLLIAIRSGLNQWKWGSDLLLPHVALLPELVQYEAGFIGKPLNCNAAERAEPVQDYYQTGSSEFEMALMRAFTCGWSSNSV